MRFNLCQTSLRKLGPEYICSFRENWDETNKSFLTKPLSLFSPPSRAQMDLPESGAPSDNRSYEEEGQWEEEKKKGGRGTNVCFPL